MLFSCQSVRRRRHSGRWTAPPGAASSCVRPGRPVPRAQSHRMSRYCANGIRKHLLLCRCTVVWCERSRCFKPQGFSQHHSGRLYAKKVHIFIRCQFAAAKSRLRFPTATYHRAPTVGAVVAPGGCPARLYSPLRSAGHSSPGITGSRRSAGFRVPAARSAPSGRYARSAELRTSVDCVGTGVSLQQVGGNDRCGQPRRTESRSPPGDRKQSTSLFLSCCSSLPPDQYPRPEARTGGG